MLHCLPTWTKHKYIIIVDFINSNYSLSYVQKALLLDADAWNPRV